MPRTSATTPALSFDKRLVLFQWIQHLLDADFGELTQMLNNPDNEGFDEEGVSRFHHAMQLRVAVNPQISKDMLLDYDANIVRHWKHVTEKRRSDGTLYPTYFQYLSLLFTEIYLDRYFGARDRLLSDLNEFVTNWNRDKNVADQIAPYEADKLNKLAFWNATGSGKTLLMHVNLMQFKHYAEKHKKLTDARPINRIILLTPNEGLTNQHLEEFRVAGLEAARFSKEGRTLFSGNAIEVIEVTKLAEESKEKTVATDSFEENNLVLVDEGHRGTSTENGAWMKRRDKLCAGGFSFEYSATFGQAVMAANNAALTQQYARCILFDYSYRFFYNDGYGKDFRILNLSEERHDAQRELYLTACLLSFYQQQKLYDLQNGAMTAYLIERPLWVFVGGSVTAKVVRTESGKQVSDVVDILLFLARFVSNRERVVRLIEILLSGDTSLLSSSGSDIFHGAFPFLVDLKATMNAENFYDDIRAVLFNAPSGGKLHVEELKSADGEIALRLGETNEAFGVINVGDAPALMKLCEEHPQELAVSDKEFSGSLFNQINKPESRVNLLIGSKKFSEGWSSWRVSTMGLLNVGKNEGSQIIQLFGRGVRLKGYAFRLKRSSRFQNRSDAPAAPRRPQYISLLETLNVFGVRASYMEQFKKYLEAEGVKAKETTETVTVKIYPDEAQRTAILKDLKLLTLKLRDGIDFKKSGPRPSLQTPRDSLRQSLMKSRILLDWYPKVAARDSRELKGIVEAATKNETFLSATQLAFLDWDRVFFEIEEYKNERAWYNLNLSRESLRAALNDHEWYVLKIPANELEYTGFERVRIWQEIAVALLKKLCDRAYKFHKDAYESEHLELQELAPDDENFFFEYSIEAEPENDALKMARRFNEKMANGTATSDFQSGLHAVCFENHLFQPLLCLDKSSNLSVKPVALDTNERLFVTQLQKFCEDKKNEGFFEGKKLYLLRNSSKKGLGFFEAGNFYPDFLLWIVTPACQHLSFVDPKGLRNLNGATDPKILFYQKVKEREAKLNASNGKTRISLESFLISNTALGQLGWNEQNLGYEDFEAMNVFFDDTTYMAKLLHRAAGIAV